VQGYRPVPPAAGTAKILILIGLILQAIEVAVVLLFGLVFLIVPLAAAVFLGVAIIGILWIVLIYLFSYRRVSDGDYAGARTPTLVFAILSLITVNLISGILYIIGYVEIGSAISQQASMAPPGYPGGPPPGWGTAPPMAGAPPSLPSVGATRICAYCGKPGPATGTFCPSCGAAYQ
jgi:hypothetical protein